MKNPNWLPLEAVKEYLSFDSDTTIYTGAKKYQIRQSKFMSQTYFSREDIDRALEENAVVWQPNLRA